MFGRYFDEVTEGVQTLFLQIPHPAAPAGLSLDAYRMQQPEADQEKAQCRD